MACMGLGQISTIEGRQGEGLDLLRNALAAATLCEANPSGEARDLTTSALEILIEALFRANEIHEVTWSHST